MARISFVAGSLFAGLVAGALVDLWAIRLAIAGVAFALALLAQVKGGRSRSVVVAFAALLTGLALPVPTVPPPTPPPGLYRVEAEVERYEVGEASGPGGPTRVGSREGSSNWATLRVLEGSRVEDGLPLPDGIRIMVRGTLPEGARVRVLTRLRPTVTFRNRSPHVPWPRRRISARGVLVGEPEVLAQSTWAETRGALRSALRQRLAATLAPGPRGVAQALVLGDRRAVDQPRREVVRRAGLAHVLAVSGLHVAITIGLLIGFLSWLFARTPWLAERFDTARLAAAVGAPAALLYAELAGGAPSARRAALTAALFFAARASGRRPLPVAVATTAILMLVAMNPDQVLDPGLALSVVATLAILSGLRREGSSQNELVFEEDAARHPLWAAAHISARATVATAPIVWWCFGSVPAISIVANVVLAPLAGALLLPAALAHTAMACLGPIAAGPTGWVFEHVEAAFTAGSSLFAAVSLGHDLPPPTLPQGIAAAVGALTLLSVRGIRKALITVIATGLALALLEGHVRTTEHPTGVLRVTFLDVDQGDAALVDMPDGSLMVIDGGGGSAHPGRRALLPLLAARRRTHVDVAVLTHPHPDHYEGLIDLFGAMPVGELWDSGQAEAEALAEAAPSAFGGGSATALLASARRSGTVVLGPESLCGAPRDFGGAEVRVLAPCPSYDPGYDPNDNSVVFSLRYGQRSFLFTGDAEGFEEARLSELGDALAADVLKVPHHGSRTSSSAAFLARVHPRLSVISAGVENRFGHPHSEVFRRLAGFGRVLSTNRDGGVEVVTDGRAMQVRPYHGATFALW